MKDYEKLLEYLINIVKIAKDSNGNIFQIKENSYTKKENSFMEYKLKEKTVSRNINNDRVFPVDNQTLDEFYNETEMNLDYAIIHTGSYADELTRSLHTLALTVGKDIYFRNKAYKPETTEEIKTSEKFDKLPDEEIDNSIIYDLEIKNDFTKPIIEAKSGIKNDNVPVFKEYREPLKN